MRDNEKEDARKGGGGADKRGGAHSRYQFFRCGKIGGGGGGGGRINDGGRSGGTLRYMCVLYTWAYALHVLDHTHLLTYCLIIIMVSAHPT